jgi:exonuclease SbcD
VARHEQDPPVWLDIEITTDDYLHDMQRKIQALTEDLPVEVCWCAAAASSARKSANAPAGNAQRTEGEEVFERRSGAGRD